jgi:hypothetical protein
MTLQLGGWHLAAFSVGSRRTRGFCGRGRPRSEIRLCFAIGRWWGAGRWVGGTLCLARLDTADKSVVFASVFVGNDVGDRSAFLG